MRNANLSEYKDKKDFSLGELSEALGVSISYLSMILSGQRPLRDFSGPGCPAGRRDGPPPRSSPL